MIPKHLMESKLITDEEWEEYQRLKEEIKELKEKLNLAENILYDYLYKDGKITKELYFKVKGE